MKNEKIKNYFYARRRAWRAVVRKIVWLRGNYRFPRDVYYGIGVGFFCGLDGFWMGMMRCLFFEDFLKLCAMR